MMQALLSIMMLTCVYPTSWGIALIRAMIKPGKPKDDVKSLRGIRLLCSMASWFGRVIDQRTRQAWAAGYEQFGFKPRVGCSEAVLTLLALIYSRTYE
eukprot:2251762-Karenia_brevis.AAC.1